MSPLDVLARCISSPRNRDEGSPSQPAREGEEEQERRERMWWPQGGVAPLRCVHRSWWSGCILGTGYQVPSTRYQVLGSQRQVGSERIYREGSEQGMNEREENREKGLREGKGERLEERTKRNV